MIIAVHREAINAAYGAGSWTRLSTAIAAYTRSLTATGITPTLLYLDAPATAGLTSETPAVLGDSSGSARLIRAAARLTPLPPAAVLLVGGEEALPMFRFPARPTVADDSDRDIPTDNPYGCLREGPGVEVDPDVPVGRLAAGVDDGVDALIAQLEAARRDRRRTAPTGALVVSNDEWIPASRVVAAAIRGGASTFRTAPTYSVTPDTLGDLSKRLLVFNLHGVPTSSDWFGRGGWDTLAPSSIADVSMAGTTVFACGCFSGAIDDRSTITSLALQFLSRGCTAYIGATGYAFGGVEQPCDFAEELARRFVTILGMGLAAGAALRRARHEYVVARTHAGAMPNRDYKTALQFVFLGDPLL